MFNLILKTPHLQNTGNTAVQWKWRATSEPARGGEKAARPAMPLLAKALIFLVGLLVGLQILFPAFCLQEAAAQKAAEYEISRLEQQLKRSGAELASLDAKLKSLGQRAETVKSEVDKLKEEPRSFLGRITGIFRRRNLEKLYTESQELDYKIRNLRKKREPLVAKFLEQADELIDESSSRTAPLMEEVRKAILGNDDAGRNRAWEQLSALWELTERTKAARETYSPITPNPETTRTFPQLLSNDPEELRLGAAILKELAAAVRDEIALLSKQREELKARESMLEDIVELVEEMRRMDEEREPVGIVPGTTIIPQSFSDMATNRELDDIEGKLDQLSPRIQQFTDDVELFESQSKSLERRAFQIEADLRGKLEHD